ncbi:MAG TPA: hypothetical protein VHZ25_05755, partial [Acidobacteriaceae bacterium]|nr:hypothetical protein [Acidobacteriaceae bacterium]
GKIHPLFQQSLLEFLGEQAFSAEFMERLIGDFVAGRGDRDQFNPKPGMRPLQLGGDDAALRAGQQAAAGAKAKEDGRCGCHDSAARVARRRTTILGMGRGRRKNPPSDHAFLANETEAFVQSMRISGAKQLIGRGDSRMTHGALKEPLPQARRAMLGIDDDIADPGEGCPIGHQPGKADLPVAQIKAKRNGVGDAPGDSFPRSCRGPVGAAQKSADDIQIKPGEIVADEIAVLFPLHGDTVLAEGEWVRKDKAKMNTFEH